MLVPDQVEELKSLYGAVSSAEEGGIGYLLLASVALPEGCKPNTSEVLFCPVQRDGYESRLYFPAKIQSRVGLNWNSEARILDRNWFAYSWKPNASGLRLAQMVAMHLQALR